MIPRTTICVAASAFAQVASHAASTLTDARYVIVAECDPAAPDQPYLSIAEHLAEHRSALAVIRMEPDRLNDALEAVRDLNPAFVAFIVPPGRINDNFVGRVFEAMTRFDDDPLLDCAHGFITGRTPEDAEAMVRRTLDAERHHEAIGRKFTGIAHTFAAADLGPFATEQAMLFKRRGYDVEAIIGVDDSDEWKASREREVAKLSGSSIVFCAGHGMGDWMCAIDGALLRNLTLDHAIVFNGTCHSAATTTRHDIDPQTMGIVTTPIDPMDSVALNFIAAGAVGQFASTASSSWMNVGPMADGLLHESKTLGEALRDRLNAHLQSHDVREVRVLPFVEGNPSPQFLGEARDPGYVQSVARVILLGDPAYRPFPHPLERITLPPAPQAARNDGVRGEKAAIAELIARLDDPHAPAFEALNLLIARGGEAVPPLIDAMQTSANWQIPKALGAIGDERAIDPLIDKVADQPTSPLRDVVVEALQLLTGKDYGSDAEAWRAWRKKETDRSELGVS